jgi:hypothetical protein
LAVAEGATGGGTGAGGRARSAIPPEAPAAKTKGRRAVPPHRKCGSSRAVALINVQWQPCRHTKVRRYAYEDQLKKATPPLLRNSGGVRR